jgi:hypothetical protein
MAELPPEKRRRGGGGAEWNIHTDPITSLSYIVKQNIFAFLDREEDRMNLCRTNKDFQAMCRGRVLYGPLVAEEFPDFRSREWKEAIVGGNPVSDGYDGTWARYYRLLIRGTQMREAIRLYIETVPLEVRRELMETYERLPAEKRVRVERELTKSFDFVARHRDQRVFHRHELLEPLLPIDEYFRDFLEERWSEAQKLARIKELFIGNSPLGWARLQLAAQSIAFKDSYILPLYPLLDYNPSVFAKDYFTHMKRVVEVAVASADLTLLDIMYQIDGPFYNSILKDQSQEASTQYAFTDTSDPVTFFRRFLFETTMRSPPEVGTSVIDFVVDRFAIYTYEYDEDMAHFALHNATATMLVELIRIDFAVFKQDPRMLKRVSFWIDNASKLRERHNIVLNRMVNDLSSASGLPLPANT